MGKLNYFNPRDHPLPLSQRRGFGLILWEKSIPGGSSGTPMLPPAPYSVTVYSVPQLTEAEKSSMQTQGVYRNGHLHWLQVTNVDSTSRLATEYGLKPGDVITNYNGYPISDVNDLKVVTVRVIAAAKSSFSKYTVQRDRNWLALTCGHAPVDAKPEP